MARSVDRDQTESPGFELDELERSIRSSFRLHGSSSRRNSIIDDEYELQWAAIERLGTFERVRKSVVDENGSSSEDQKVKKKKKVVDVTKLGALERRLLIEKLIKHIQNDNLRLLMFYFSPIPGIIKSSSDKLANHHQIQVIYTSPLVFHKMDGCSSKLACGNSTCHTGEVLHIT